MNNYTILWILGILGWGLAIALRIKNRETTVPLWIKENAWGLGISMGTLATYLLIGPDNDADLGTRMAREWAFGIGGTAAAALSGAFQPKTSVDRKAAMRVESKAMKANPEERG